MEKLPRKYSSIAVAGQQVLSLALHLAQIFVLSRMLTPDDYGVAQMAGTVFTMANVFKDFGFSISSIQSRDLLKQDTDNLFWVGNGISFSMGFMIMLCSPLVGWFFNDTRVVWMVVAMGVTYWMASIGNQPIALAQRNFSFFELAIWASLAKIVAFGTGCILGALSFGAWTIVWMHFVEAFLVSVSGFWISKYIPGSARNIRSTVEHLKFGAWMTVSGLLSFISRNIDKILIGRFFGAESLGLYSRAQGLLIFPFTGILSGFTRLNLATFSRLREDNGEFNRSLILLLQVYLFVSALLILPALVVSEDVIRISMGEKWISVAPLFVIMGPMSGFRLSVTSVI